MALEEAAEAQQRTDTKPGLGQTARSWPRFHFGRSGVCQSKFWEISSKYERLPSVGASVRCDGYTSFMDLVDGEN